MKNLLSESVLLEPLSSLKSDLLKIDGNKNADAIKNIDAILTELKLNSPNVQRIISLLDEVTVKVILVAKI